MFLMAAFFAAAVSGCGTNGGSKNEITKISVGYWPAKTGVELTNMEERKARFEEANPNIEIEPDTWTFDLQTFYPKRKTGGGRKRVVGSYPSRPCHSCGFGRFLPEISWQTLCGSNGWTCLVANRPNVP